MELTVNQPFDLAATFECGQGHRWLKDQDDDGWYEGVLGDDVVRIRQVDGAVQFRCATDEKAMAHRLHRHFRLDDDIEAIYRDLGKRDSKMAVLVGRYPGLRVMRVDPWECPGVFHPLRQYQHSGHSQVHGQGGKGIRLACQPSPLDFPHPWRHVPRIDAGQA